MLGRDVRVAPSAHIGWVPHRDNPGNEAAAVQKVPHRTHTLQSTVCRVELKDRHKCQIPREIVRQKQVKHDRHLALRHLERSEVPGESKKRAPVRRAAHIKWFIIMLFRICTMRFTEWQVQRLYAGVMCILRQEVHVVDGERRWEPEPIDAYPVAFCGL